MNFTLQDIIDIAGQPSKESGGHTHWQCPYCQDRGKDNLVFTAKKNLLTCFADPSHSRLILQEIGKKKKALEQPKPTQEAKQWQINLEEYLTYQHECNSQLLASSKALNYLYEHRLITRDTVELCGLGYDFEDNKWVIPIYSLKEQRLVGFKYRRGDFTQKGEWCETDTPSTIAMIWGKEKNENLYICEGMLDGYVLTQWMDYPEHSTIYTPSMGVGSLKNSILEINFNNFENIYLCLDNDKPKWNKKTKKWVAAGPANTKELLERYPFMIDKTPKPKLGNDITDLYREMMK